MGAQLGLSSKASVAGPTPAREPKHPSWRTGFAKVAKHRDLVRRCSVIYLIMQRFILVASGPCWSRHTKIKSSLLNHPSTNMLVRVVMRS